MRGTRCSYSSQLWLHLMTRCSDSLIPIEDCVYNLTPSGGGFTLKVLHSPFSLVKILIHQWLLGPLHWSSMIYTRPSDIFCHWGVCLDCMLFSHTGTLRDQRLVDHQPVNDPWEKASDLQPPQCFSDKRFSHEPRLTILCIHLGLSTGKQRTWHFLMTLYWLFSLSLKRWRSFQQWATLECSTARCNPCSRVVILEAQLL